VGYRWYDARKLEPFFPFGYGLSYTTFAYSGLKTTRQGDGLDVSFVVRNTGAAACDRPRERPPAGLLVGRSTRLGGGARTAGGARGIVLARRPPGRCRHGGRWGAVTEGNAHVGSAPPAEGYIVIGRRAR
jgi:hypothetical protein